MVLQILYVVGNTILPPKYYTHVVVAVVGIMTAYAFSQGCKTDRERDLHGRTILITAASISKLHHLAVLLIPHLSSGCLHPERLNPLNIPGSARRTRHSSHTRASRYGCSRLVGVFTPQHDFQ